MTRVLCIGDSSALPGHWNKYEDTWIYLLKRRYSDFDFITFFQRALTTEILNSCGGGQDGIDNMPKGADVLEFYEPDIIVLQLGVVDCAPRLVNRNSLFYKVLIRLPDPVSSSLWSIIKWTTKRKSTTVDVPLNRFLSNIENYIVRAIAIDVREIIIIKICTPDNRISNRSPAFIDNVINYNSQIDKLGIKYACRVKVIDPLNEDALMKYKDIYQDGYHPNSVGHSLIFESLVGVLA